MGIQRNQKVYGADVRLVPPGGRKRRPTPDQKPREAEAVLANLSWRRFIWRQGTKGPLAARFAAIRIRVSDGAVLANNRHPPGDEVWRIGELCSSGERKFAPSLHSLFLVRCSRNSAPAPVAKSNASDDRTGEPEQRRISHNQSTLRARFLEPIPQPDRRH